MLLTLDAHLDITPDRRAGKPCIVGTRIAVQDIVFWHVQQGQPTVEIAAKYDLPLAGVYAALAYYYEHRDSIDAEMAAEEAEVAKMIAAAPSSPFQHKLAELKRTDEWKRA